jgi:hypothetical protein
MLFDLANIRNYILISQLFHNTKVAVPNSRGVHAPLPLLHCHQRLRIRDRKKDCLVGQARWTNRLYLLSNEFNSRGGVGSIDLAERPVYSGSYRERDPNVCMCDSDLQGFVGTTTSKI